VVCSSYLFHRFHERDAINLVLVYTDHIRRCIWGRLKQGIDGFYSLESRLLKVRGGSNPTASAYQYSVVSTRPPTTLGVS
jgi:hypothetical protein